MKLGKAIKTARVRNGMKQQDLAEALGVSSNYISLLENDHRDPSWGRVCKLAEALEVPLPLLILLASEQDQTGSVGESPISFEIAREMLTLLAATR